MHCFVCQGRNPDCALCRGRGRTEILRAGLVDPQVFKQVNIDPEKYSGFVFGMDIDRAARLLYRIDGLGPLLENEIKIQRRFFLP
jgi:phenylalanyl-tRNA synthetase alpha chain